MSILEVRDIAKSYRSGGSEIRALDDVSFTVEEGHMVAVLGPSGSGKTTLLSIIAGLLRPTSGEIVVDGERVHLHTQREAAAFRRERVGIVFQDYHLIPYLDAMDNLLLIPRLGGRVRREDRERAEGLLEEFGLGDRRTHLPAKLSGGERQRVAIARALMAQPEIMLVDEPTANLDTERGHQVVAMLRDHVRGRRMTCLMVTHDERMCEDADRVIRLVDGRMT